MNFKILECVWDVTQLLAYRGTLLLKYLVGGKGIWHIRTEYVAIPGKHSSGKTVQRGSSASRGSNIGRYRM